MIQRDAAWQLIWLEGRWVAHEAASIQALRLADMLEAWEAPSVDQQEVWRLEKQLDQARPKEQQPGKRHAELS